MVGHDGSARARIVGLRCCIDFCYTTKWISSTHTHMSSLSCISPPHTPAPHPTPKHFFPAPNHCLSASFFAWILLLIQSLLASQLPDFLPGEKVNFPECSLLICVLWAPLIVCINSFPEGREKLLPFLKGRKIRVERTFIFTPWHAPAFTSNSTPPSPPHWPVTSSELLEENQTSSWWKIRCWGQQASPPHPSSFCPLKKRYKDRGQHNIIQQLFSSRKKKWRKKWPKGICKSDVLWSKCTQDSHSDPGTQRTIANAEFPSIPQEGIVDRSTTAGSWGLRCLFI